MNTRKRFIFFFKQLIENPNLVQTESKLYHFESINPHQYENKQIFLKASILLGEKHLQKLASYLFVSNNFTLIQSVIDALPENEDQTCHEEEVQADAWVLAGAFTRTQMTRIENLAKFCGAFISPILNYNTKYLVIGKNPVGSSKKEFFQLQNKLAEQVMCR